MNPEMSPEMVLWSRVLLQAIWDLAGIKLKVQKSEAPRLQRRTRAWFLATKDSPGSFIWICNTLQLDPDAVRDRVLARSTAELRTLISSQPEAWDPASIVRVNGDAADSVASESEQEAVEADTERVAESVACEESETDPYEDSPRPQRVALAAAAAMFQPAPMQALQETLPSSFA